MRNSFWGTFLEVLGFAMYFIIGIALIVGSTIGAALLGYYLIHPIAGIIFGAIAGIVSFCLVVTAEDYYGL